MWNRKNISNKFCRGKSMFQLAEGASFLSFFFLGAACFCAAFVDAIVPSLLSQEKLIGLW